MVKILRL